METIKFKTHVGKDGLLKLELPTSITNREVEILVVMQPVDEEVDELGWPLGFFDRTYGALAAYPLERSPQPPLETRDNIE